ncbi:MAG: cytochrome b/b6 domain-containing protein [Candidatus Promineifilaceae bacterium]|nr:cytochrome b/b6 domain-containing protein [Candidatus Promineifilaceae bacterium]
MAHLPWSSARKLTIALWARPKRRRARLLAVGTLLLGLLLIAYGTASAQSNPLHPTFPLLDQDGQNVLSSGQPVSTMTTCGACHDTAFIAEHSFHADVGLNALAEPGETGSGREWDTSPGLFGRWNPLTYRYLSPAIDERVDLTTAEWIQLFGVRHVGGGPAETAQSGDKLTDLPLVAGDPETHIVDPQTGRLVPWDWQASGTVEMNCFLCHLPEPNNEARIEALHDGQFGWASTATLLGTGLVDRVGDQWQWNETAFDEDGQLLESNVTVQGPSSANCAQCHGLVQVGSQTPLALDSCAPDQWSTITTGQIVSPQRIADSGMNISSKEDLGRSWDVHAERILECTDCHYSLNNPVYYQETDDSQPDHLIFDPRRIDLGDYLYRPLHQFAKGQSAQGVLAPELDNTLRRCESCHSIEATHEWLPYKERHMDAVSCESCHIPKMHAPARQYVDWTVLQADGTAVAGCRGIDEEGETFSSVLITPYEPVLLPRDSGDGSTTLAPHNLLTSWFWIYGDPARPVPQRDLQAAWLDGSDYHPEILDVFDANEDGQLDQAELVIDDNEKETLIAARLAALGLDDPRIRGEVQPYSINHNVTHGEWATKECSTCHGEQSLITQPIQLADRLPGQNMPSFVGDGPGADSGTLYSTDSGQLYYQLETDETGLYILGYDSVDLIDLIGSIAFLGTLLGVVAHGGLRFFTARRRLPSQPELRDVYMYSVYERFWHWLQTIVILLLIFTGLIIHKPDHFGLFSFSYVVQVHNILALILVVNAALAAFYHLASGEIQQFLPRPRGFFDQAFAQAKYYLQGIFRGQEHPFEKTPQRKMNPLQQVTYFAILNILLPLQTLTGLFMWGAQRWPDLVTSLGGLPFLAPLHTLTAWLFASFIVMHVYLTTTGHEPLVNIKGMITGWDEVEVHHRESPSPTTD